MAIYEAPRAPSTSGKAGEAWAKGLGEALQGLSTNKLNLMKQRHEQKETGKVLETLGLPAHYAMLPKQHLDTIIKEHALRSGVQPKQQQQDPQQILSALQELIQNQPGGQQGSSSLQQLLGSQPGKQQNKPQGGFNIFSGSIGPQGQMPGNPIIPTSAGGTGYAQQSSAAQQLSPANPQSGQQALNAVQEQQDINKESGDPFTKMFGNPAYGARPAERVKAAMAQQNAQNKKEYQEARLEAKRIDQNLNERRFMHQQEVQERPYYEEMQKDHEASRTSLNDLDRLTTLLNKGDVVNPTEDHMYRWAARTLKLNLKDLRGADTEEFEKIVAGFIKNAKNWFGSRVTNYDLQSFLKTLPQLTTSHEGKMRLIGSMRAAALAQKIRYEAFQDLMRLNDGHIPPYAKMKVDEMTQDAMDALSKQFISGDLAPKLSPEGIASMQRNQWMRWVKAILSAIGPAEEAASSGAQTIGKIGGHVASAAGALL